MSQITNGHEQHLLPSASDVGDALQQGPRTNPLARLLVSSRRHWLTVLLVWILVGLPGTGAVWLLVKPTHTATGYVKVEPATPILFPEVDSPQQMSGFDAFLNTQAQEISSSSVLQAALADPSLKGLPLVGEAAAVGMLRQNLTVDVVPKTHLVRVCVTDADPNVAIQLTKAVLGAYRTRAGGAQLDGLRRKREILEEERKRLSNDLDIQQKDLYSYAQRYGATSEMTIDALRETLANHSEEAYRERDQAQVERIQLEEQLKQLEAGHVPTTMPGEEFTLKEQLVQNDPEVRLLREALAGIRVDIARQGLTKQNREHEEHIREMLQKAEARAGEDAERKMAERRRSVDQDLRLRLTQQLEAAKRRCDVFGNRIKEGEENSLSMGQTGLQIKKIQDRLESISRDYKIIDQSISKLDLESRRAERITVDENAEILPGGVNNKRSKLLPVAFVGALCLGIGVAFLRDVISGRVYSAHEVESAVGLRLLGTVPALQDLKRGRISGEDFRQSYRAIVARLAGASPDGQIPRTLLVTSAMAAEGKTSLAVSLAASLAETGCRVLVIDGDVQAPRIAATLGLNLPYTLRDVLTEEKKLAEAVGPAQVPSLHVLMSRRNGTSGVGLLTSRLAARLCKTAAETYDYIIVDSPPVLGAADALIWSSVVDGVIVSSFAGYSNASIMREACNQLASAGGRILGTVICNLPVQESYYAYSSYSSAQPSDSGKGTARQAGTAPLVRLPCVHVAGTLLESQARTDEKPRS